MDFNGLWIRLFKLWLINSQEKKTNPNQQRPQIPQLEKVCTWYTLKSASLTTRGLDTSLPFGCWGDTEVLEVPLGICSLPGRNKNDSDLKL